MKEDTPPRNQILSHHLHTAKAVRDSSIRDLDDVLAYLAKKILD